MTYDLDEILSLTDLTDVCYFSNMRSYLLNRYMHDLEQYKSRVSCGDLIIARVAIEDATDDLHRLLRKLDPTFEYGDAELLNRMYLDEFMHGWQY